MTKPTMHRTLSKDLIAEPIVMPPHAGAPGHEFLDASLRDMTGVLHSRLRLSKHEPHTLTNENSPGWTCLKAASQQRRKLQAEIRTKKLEHPHRKIRRFGDQGMGDHVVFTDFMARGGVHGSKEANIHKDLGKGGPFMIPTSAKGDVETLKAMNHIYGEHPRRSYYSDNAEPLENAAIRAGLKSELSAPGVSQTNGLIESANQTVISGRPGDSCATPGCPLVGGHLLVLVIVY